MTLLPGLDQLSIFFTVRRVHKGYARLFAGKQHGYGAK
jgi:hypothetical protein